MKEKIFSFIREKKDLLIFIGILSLVFVSVIFIANYALSSDVPAVSEDPNTEVPSINDGGNDPDPVNPITPVYYFKAPVNDSVIVRTFFDDSYDDTVLETAMINTGDGIEESTGVGYALENNSEFDVCTMYSGKVINVESNDVRGYIVTISHGNDVFTKYQSLASINVKNGDQVTEDSVIGKAGSCILDSEAGIHVFVELFVDNTQIDPTLVVGKKLTEVSSMK